MFNLMGNFLLHIKPCIGGSQESVEFALFDYMMAFAI